MRPDRLLLATLLALIAGAATAADDPFTGVERLDADAILAAAQERSPMLAASRAAALGAQARARRAGGLPDPVLSYEVAPWTLGRGNEPGHRVELAQAFPWPGVRDARQAAEGARAAVAAADAGEAGRELLLMSRKTAAAYWLATRRLQIGERALAQMRSLRTTAEAAAGAGGSLAEAAEAAVGEAAAERVVAAAKRELVEAPLHIAELIGLPLDTVTLPPPADPPEALPLPDRELLLSVARRRPAGDAAQAAVDAAGAELRGTRRERFGGIALSVSYSSMEERWEEDYQVGVSFEIPLDQGRRAAAVAEAAAALERARAEQRARLIRLDREAIDAYVHLEEGAAAIASLRERALPMATQAAAGARAALAGGAGSTAAAVRAERMLLEVELDLAMRVAEYQEWLGELECCIGVPVRQLLVRPEGAAP